MTIPTKITVMFKTPDTITEAIEESISHITDEDAKEEARQDIAKKLSKFVKWSEFITIEFNLDSNTATVQPIR